MPIILQADALKYYNSVLAGCSQEDRARGYAALADTFIVGGTAALIELQTMSVNSEIVQAQLGWTQPKENSNGASKEKGGSSPCEDRENKAAGET